MIKFVRFCDCPHYQEPSLKQTTKSVCSMYSRPSTSGGRTARSLTPDPLTRVNSSFDPPTDCATSAAYGSWYYEETAADPSLVGYPPNTMSNIIKRLPTPLHSTHPPIKRAELVQRNERQSEKMRIHRLDSEDSTMDEQLVPVLGFGGWYTGKSNGKIGTTNIHKQPSIAIADPANSWKAPTRSDPVYLEPANMAYGDLEEVAQSRFPAIVSPQSSQHSSQQSSSQPTPIVSPSNSFKFAINDNQKFENLIQIFQSKLSNLYPVKYKREKHLFLVFSGRDIHNTELCSIEEFKHSLILLNFTPSDSDFRLLINEFKSEEKEEENLMHYMRFISRMCEGADKVKYILNPF
mmetsp:Transcript_28068/g.26930  ORF Transcript_28068/g.26930 Transcript_28068/m.26930 type:complete len:349 (+) Transcript_28068:21-1067(+)